MSTGLTNMEQLLSEGVKQLRQQIQERDARIAELEKLVQQANFRLKTAGFTHDANGELFRE